MKLNNDQIEFLNKCTVGRWKLNPKGLVDIDGNFNCTEMQLKDFKGIKFGLVTGDFDCQNNNLTSLKGAPREVVRGFLLSE